ncbi:fimbrial biogenesis outer membrane usher protein [Luteibacter aegosomaticola]|uniref:fimbria/pilus outer membrane usher protein n=1 Tax=Luteibacter aegosomaticola TaxID=2911538 RepID=UPI001FFA6389|nr:fimbria/pilus outer membrane usher protein [Luteibacter aegosomaticola]UPG90349.1 fimbrial biogenesis outer membrane usher protein [Luteibacter aegosomaticola]
MNQARTQRARRKKHSAPGPLALALALASPAAAAAVDPLADPNPQATFSSDFLHTGTSVDLSRFERGNVVLAGTYRVALEVNGRQLPGHRDIHFKPVAESASAQPCLDGALLVQLGLDREKLAERTFADPAYKTLGEAPVCGQLGAYIPGATIDFDEGEQLLRITMPQVLMASLARGYVSPELWSEGVSAGMLNYNANTYHLRGSDGRRTTSTYVGLRAGANLGGWRLRHVGSFNLGGGRHRWQNTQSYAQHDLTDAKAQLTLGEAYTSGDILESVRFRGAAIASDPRMLPASQRGYAPVIRGIAESNAQVTVRQNGYVIHSTTVAPGAFEITDLYPTGYGSDLEVVVTEADGRTRTTVVPFTSVPQMLREGTSRFAISAGQVADDSLARTPFVFQATAQRGVTANTTLYVGTSASNSYWSGLVGAGVNLPIGAVSLDVTGSRAAFRAQGVRRGVSTRLRYARTLTSTGTTFGVAAYRFSTRDYLGIVDAARVRERARLGIGGDPVGGARSRLDANFTQPLAGGQFQLTGALVDYWHGRGRSLDYAVGYGNSVRSATYNVSVQRSRLGDVTRASGQTRRISDTTVYLSLSIPLGTSRRAPNLSTTFNRGTSAGHAANAVLNGSFDRDNDLNYTLSANRTARDDHAVSSGSASLAWRGQPGSYRLGAGRTSAGSSQFSLTANGSVVAHAHGVTFSQELGETNAIIHAPGAAGSRVESAQGVRLDRRGNAVVRGLMPYQLNAVSIDPRGASHDVELASTTETSVPRAGAMALLEYRTTVAQSLLIHATRADGSPLPFGASVLDEAGQAVGVVGQASKIFARGALAGSRLTVQWGEGTRDRCVIAVPESLDGAVMHGLHRAVRAGCEAAGSPVMQKAA